MMRQLIFGLASVLAIGLTAQARLEFEKTAHDFGQIKEADGAAEYSFIFTNKGNEPLIISAVKASCGCTTPFWTREPVMPGESGKITASYNTMNRPGAFNKTLSVASNSAGGSITLSIKGSVTPKVKTVEDLLPNKLGAMRIQNRVINFGKITTEKPVTKSYDVYNDSDTAFSFVSTGVVSPSHITFDFEPLELKPRQQGAVKITYDPSKNTTLGYQTEKISLETTELKSNKKELSLVVTVEEYFPPLSPEERAQAPKLVIDRASHDFGRITSGSKVETTFTLTNAGKKPLNIRSTVANCECTVVSLDKDTIAPGQSAKMKVSLDTKGRRGRQFKNVTIFSNDPAAPTQVVNIKAES